MKNTAVDVVIPSYNSLPWLEYAIDSVLDQTHSNINLYVIDDGSTDDTEKFMNSLRDPRITYLKKENGGVSSARNIGIANSKADYIAFLDADDTWKSDKIEKQLELMENNNSLGLVYGHHYVIDKENIILGNNRYYERGNVFEKLLTGNFISGSASMALVRRSTLEKAGSYFNETLDNGEDWELWLRIANISEIDFVPEILASIRSHDNNAQANLKKMADSLVRAYEIILNEFKLSTSQKRQLASTCLYHAAVQYRKSGDYHNARLALFRLFKANPPAYKALINWKIAIVPGEFMRIIFSSKNMENIKSIVIRELRSLKRSIRRIK